MIQVLERGTYDEAARLLDSLIDRDAELPDQVLRPGVATLRIIDIVELWTVDFFNAAKEVMRLESDQSRLLVAGIRPDPIDYYYRHFRKFPLFQFGASDDAQAYLDALNADPGDSPADALVYNAAVLAVFPESCRWVVYGDRDFEVAIIATADRATGDVWSATSFRERFYSAGEAVEELLAMVYRGNVPRDAAEAFMRNYDVQKGQ